MGSVKRIVVAGKHIQIISCISEPENGQKIPLHCIIIPMILKDHQREKNVILRIFADYWETFKVAYPTYDNNF